MSVERAVARSTGPTGKAFVRPTAAVIATIAVAGGLVAALCLALLAGSSDPGADADGHWYVQLAANLFTIGVGLIMWRARPGNRVGPLVILMGFASTIDFLSLDGENGLAWTVGDMWNLLGFVILANVYLAFPAGRTSGWSRRLVILVYAWFFVLSLGRRLVDPYPTSWPFSNPFLLSPNEALAATLSLVAYLGALVLTVLVVGTVLDRWRRGSVVERRALAPVFWVSPVTLVVVGTFFVGQVTGSDALIAVSTGPLAQLSNVLLPLAFLAGLLQTRLERGSIADLVSDLDGAAPGDVEAALARAVHDPTLRLAFVAPDGAGYVDSAGKTMKLPRAGEGRDVTRIEGTDRAIAILVHDSAVDAALIASAAAAARLALENERLAAELRSQLEEVRASRARIVEATDEERQRLERDLHDGAQQRLVALGFTLRRANRRVTPEDPELGQILDEANRELEDGLRELRALARGIHPTTLTDGGLAPAIRELADRYPVPVDLHIEDRRLPTAIEMTAYFIIAEALTNTLRHAEASRVRIRGRVISDAFELEIADDGRGGVTDATGSGVRGLVDRAEAIGGTLSIQSPVGVGTTVRARLPLA